jgi:hypothetical protein
MEKVSLSLDELVCSWFLVVILWLGIISLIRVALRFSLSR